jgi:hypothetical protein
MGSRRRAAAVLAVVLAAGGLTLGSSPVSAAECPAPLSTCVVVKVVRTIDGKMLPIGDPLVLGPAELQTLSDENPDLNLRRYDLRKNPKSTGGKITPDIARGKRVSISTLLAKLTNEQQAAKATFVETPNTAGVPSVLAPGDLVDPDGTPSTATPTSPSPSPSPTPGAGAYPFLDKLEPAVFLTPGGQLGYVRPLRDADEDTNGADYFQVAGRLDVTVHTTGSLISPTVTSSAGSTLDRGAPTTFSATFPDKLGSRVASTTWDFGDGSIKNTKRATPSKSYAKKGTYPVAVSVRLNDGSYGRSAAVEIKVANPPKAPSSGTGGGTGLGGPGGSGSGSGTTFPPYEPPADDYLPPSDTEEPPVEEPEQPPAPVDDGLEPVEGFVLAGAEIVPGGTPETIPGTQNSATPAPATQQSMRSRIATWVVAIFAVALLVGMGAASETRWFRHRLRHLRRRA